MKILDIAKMNLVESMHQAYNENSPFPHIIIDQLWDNDFLLRVEKECNEQKYWNTNKSDAFTFSLRADNFNYNESFPLSLSISSNKTKVYGRLLTASVNWPPSE